MKKEFLMGTSDILTRHNTFAVEDVKLSSGLRDRLHGAAIERALSYFSSEFNLEKPADPGIAASLDRATSIGLFQSGGIKEEDYINLRALCEVLKPKLYLESGVFIGSSLHAFCEAHFITRVIAIDPDLSKLKFRREKVEYVRDRDFSEFVLRVDKSALVFFDDHINSVQRILQARDKGFKYIIFDDSTGLHGVTQRLYPAIPTVPMIEAVDLFCAGDTLTWTYERPSIRWNTVLELSFTPEILSGMREARRAIDRIIPFPRLQDLVPARRSAPTIDAEKFLVILKD